MSKIITRLLPLLLLLLFPINAGAQQSDPQPNLNLGDAVVTGFSGTLAPDPTKPRARNKSAIDLTFINPDGPSARVINIGKPGYVWDGRLFAAPKTFDILAKDTGQVFGVALDDQPQPNIYVAATSAFGLSIVVRGRDGLPERRKKGGPGAGWMKGQFGLDLQGGPGGIYRIDGRTGVATLFANVTLDGVPNPGPGLGNLAYDSAHKQLFVSDLYTGMIHRFDLDGRDLGNYDHGVTGLGAAGLPPLPFNPRLRLNIASDRFDSENPATWGFAPAGRQVWGLAVNEGRLYYSVSAGPRIWSVGIKADGSFATDPRWELDIPAQSGPIPVSDIAFSQRGAMILAQRALIAGSYDYSAFTRPSEPQLLRFSLKAPNAPQSPGRWAPVPEEVPVGFAGNQRNSNGGVALGYGYGPDGTIDSAACASTLWTTGQNLRNNPALRSQLEPGGPLLVMGLQGSPADSVRDANVPPATSYFIDYDDKFDDARASGHMGSVRILARPCVAVAGTPSSNSPPYASGPSTTPPGTPPDNPPPPGPRYDLAIKKTAGEVKFDPATLTWTVTFTLIVTNNGMPFSPGNTISINDPVPTGMTFTSATGAGWTCTGSVNCGYAFGSGVFNTGASLVPLTITATSKTPGSYENCAAVAASGLPETTYSNNRDCVKVELKYPPNDITVVKTSQGTCAVDSICVFTITVTNNSPWPFTGSQVINETTTVPMTVTNTDLPCTPVPTSTPFTCNGTFNIPASTSQTFTVIGMIPASSLPAGTTSMENCVSVAGGQGCVTPHICSFACHMTQTQIDQIKIEKKANATECSPGGLCSYTYTVTNVSTTTATNTMPITFLSSMPAGAAFLVPPPTPLPWGCGPFGAGQIKCLYPPSSIPPGGMLTVTVTFQIASGYNQPTLTNCADFFIGQPSLVAPAVQRRAAARMDANALRSYLQMRGVAALNSIAPVPGLDDHSCTTVNIVTPPNFRAVCAPPKVPGAVPGQCACPTGTVQQGQECRRVITCRAPLIPNAASVECVCPTGTVKRGRSCVRPTVCNAPAKLNRRGVCECPTDMVARGKGCVPRERRQPDVLPNIRIPGGFGPGGGGREGPGRSGGGGEGGSPGGRR